MCKDAPGFRLGLRESERRLHVYKEAPGFRPAPRKRDASACIRRHQTFALVPVGTHPNSNIFSGMGKLPVNMERNLDASAYMRSHHAFARNPARNSRGR